MLVSDWCRDYSQPTTTCHMRLAQTHRRSSSYGQTSPRVSTLFFWYAILTSRQKTFSRKSEENIYKILSWCSDHSCLRSYISKAFCFGSKMESRPMGALSGQCLTGKKFLLQNHQDCLEISVLNCLQNAKRSTICERGPL